MTTGELITLAHYMTRTTAEAARLRLEDEGIRAWVADATVVDMNWLLGNAVGWFKLQVPEEEAERAASILREVESRRLHRRWRRASASTPPTTEGSPTMADEDQIDDLERQIYGLRLHVATLYRLLTTKGIGTPEEIRSLMEKIDAEDGAADEEFFGDVLSPPSDPA